MVLQSMYKMEYLVVTSKCSISYEVFKSNRGASVEKRDIF